MLITLLRWLNRRRSGFLSRIIEIQINYTFSSSETPPFCCLSTPGPARPRFAAALGFTQDLHFSTASKNKKSIYASRAGPPSCVAPATRLRAKPTVHLLIIHEFLHFSCLFELNPPCWKALITMFPVSSSSAAIAWAVHGRRNRAGGPIAIAAVRGSGGPRIIHSAGVKRGWCRTIRSGSVVSPSCQEDICAGQRKRV